MSISARPNLVLPDKAGRGSIEPAQEVGNEFGVQAVHTSGDEDASVQLDVAGRRLRKPCVQLHLKASAVLPAPVEVQHLVRDGARRSPEGRRQRLHHVRDRVDVLAAVAVRPDDAEQAVAEQRLDGQERLLPFPWGRKRAGGDAVPLRSCLRVGQVEVVRQGVGHGIILAPLAREEM